MAIELVSKNDMLDLLKSTRMTRREDFFLMIVRFIFIKTAKIIGIWLLCSLSYQRFPQKQFKLTNRILLDNETSVDVPLSSLLLVRCITLIIISNQ